MCELRACVTKCTNTHSSGPPRCLPQGGSVARWVLTALTDPCLSIPTGTSAASTVNEPRRFNRGSIRSVSRETPGTAVCRPSVCDCTNLDGLLTTYDVPNEILPVHGGSLFKLCGSLGTAEIKATTRPQRFVLTTHAGHELWVQPSGTIVCRHGNSQKTLNKLNTCKTARFRSSNIVKCSCRSLSIPRRVGSVFARKKSRIKA